MKRKLALVIGALALILGSLGGINLPSAHAVTIPARIDSLTSCSGMSGSGTTHPSILIAQTSCGGNIAGYLMFVTLRMNSYATGNITATPSGFTCLGSAVGVADYNTQDLIQQTCYKLLVSADQGTKAQWTINSAVQQNYWVIEADYYQGVNQTTPVAAYTSLTYSTGSSATYTPIQITPTVTNVAVQTFTGSTDGYTPEAIDTVHEQINANASCTVGGVWDSNWSRQSYSLGQTMFGVQGLSFENADTNKAIYPPTGCSLKGGDNVNTDIGPWITQTVVIKGPDSV